MLSRCCGWVKKVSTSELGFSGDVARCVSMKGRYSRIRHDWNLDRCLVTEGKRNRPALAILFL